MKYFVLFPVYDQTGIEDFESMKNTIAFIEAHMAKWDCGLDRYTVIYGDKKELVPKERIKSVEIK